MSLRDAAAGLRTDQLSAIEARSDDYGGFRRRMGDANAAQNDLGGVQFAAVAVDTETGAIRVERVVAVQDCGRPMNPKLIESQVQGGVLMGIGYALLEERVIDQHTGHVLNANLEQYKLVGARETPPIEVRAAGELPGPERDRCLRHRRAGEHRHRAGDRQCRVQRDRRAAARAADDAGGGARGARPRAAEELSDGTASHGSPRARSPRRQRSPDAPSPRRCSPIPHSRRRRLRGAEGRRHRPARPDEGGPAARPAAW